QALAMATSRENTDYLPGIALNPNLQISGELAPAILEADYVVFACPVKGLREWATRIAQVLPSAKALRGAVTLCKGLEPESLMLPVALLEDCLPGLALGTLSGPTYAREVAQEKPTAVVLASKHAHSVFEPLQEALHGGGLRVYASSDLLGVELGGALKNVYAVGAGLGQGLGLGDNAAAAYLTRALHEMVRIATAWGADTRTLYGLSGLGDLVATCAGDWSRNRGFGYAIAQGSSAAALIEDRKTVVEGYSSARAFHQSCQDKGLSAPILEAVYAVLYNALEPQEAFRHLMARPHKHEATI
ncbi:MAG: hypothetical protein B7X06_03570, partial [Verrucomicrobia bacterium 21-51-4]